MPRTSSPVPVTAYERTVVPPGLFVGTSGWAYPTWKPGFYSAKTPARAFLHEYAARLTSVEVNYTFRTLPSPSQLAAWLAATPPRFLFSFKAPQRITHFQRLRESRAAVAEFVAALEPARAAGKLGLLLFQLPPNFAVATDRLTDLLAAPALNGSDAPRVAFEFRHTSWFTEPVYHVLRASNTALCIADTEDLQTPDVATANFRCYRLRRPGGYSAPEIRALAHRFSSLSESAPLFSYFMHEDKPTGAMNAEALLHAVASGAGL